MAVTRMVKGLNLVGLVKSIRAARRVEDLPGLTDADRMLLMQNIMPGQWYAFDAFIRTLVASHQHMLGGSDDAARAMGRQSAEAALLGPHGIHLWKGDVARTVGALEKTWRQLFNFGDASLVPGETGSATFELQGYEDMTRTHGNVIMGWLQRAAELAGASSVQVQTTRPPWDGGRKLTVAITWKEGNGG